ncbi:MAG: hypothetical protein JOY58_20415, partial [Solirubrobacterales bacterium]|nr:hypothetical protein [Solirubrobacterales bacterium]
TRDQASYTLRDGSPLEITHHGERATINPGRPLVQPIPAAPQIEWPQQPKGRAPTRRRSQQ